MKLIKTHLKNLIHIKSKSNLFKLTISYEDFFTNTIFTYKIFLNDKLIMHFFSYSNIYKLVYISENTDYKQYLSRSIFRKAIRILKHNLIRDYTFYQGQ